MYDIERKFDVLALSQTKLNGKGEVMFGSVVVRVLGVDRGRAREGAALVVSDQVKEYVVGWEVCS